ncbi:proline--tRNA ligase [bacterium]|nr:MAG: proline--tRNA ligase [bacterium]
MLQSKLFYKSNKDITKSEEFSGLDFLHKGDFIEKLASGVYSFLPLGWRVLRKIQKIIREEMEAINAQEVSLPSLQPKTIWEESGRWNKMEPPLFKLKDQHNKDFALGPTHEEVITGLVKKRVQSYRDLPIFLFQIQTKFRNEIRSTGSLLRTREFLMKDLYSFHENKEDLNEYYKRVEGAYRKIFTRLNLDFIQVNALSGSIGGESSHEFMVQSPLGEDKIYFCDQCKTGFSEEYFLAKNKDKKNILCEKCNKKLKTRSVIECAHIFNLGEKYSSAFGLNFLDRNGQIKLVSMGCYGIGIGRIMATIALTHSDKNGLIWPKEVSPFLVHILNLNLKNEKAIEKIVYEIESEGIEVLYDDREDVSSGEKLIEADLIGCPLRIVVSKRTMEKGMVEIKKRGEENVEMVKLEDVIKYIYDYC